MGAVQRRNTREGFLNGIREEVQTADFPAAQDGFHLGPHFLNWIEIGAIGRKVQRFHTLSGCSSLVSCKCFLPIQANGRKNSCCLRRIQGGMVHCSLGRGRPSIKTGQIGIHSAFVQKYQVFRHLRFYGFLPFSALFPHIEHGHAHLRRVISFSAYSPLRLLPVPLLNSWQKDAVSPVSLLL